MDKTTKKILERATQTLQTARQGLADVKGDPKRRHTGLRNLVVFGRAVTNVLQNLSSVEPGFDAWYGTIVEQLKSDPLMKFFYELRTRILKQGDIGTGNYLHIKQFNFPLDMAKFGPPPKNAKNIFMGDSVGGTGWEVEIEPGVLEKYYVDLPGDIGVTGLYFQGAPGVGDDAIDADVIALSERYIARLENIVASARAEFGRNEA